MLRAVLLPVNGHDPPAALSTYKLNAVDSAHERLGIVGAIARLVCAPNVSDISKLLGTARNFLFKESLLLKIRFHAGNVTFNIQDIRPAFVVDLEPQMLDVEGFIARAESTFKKNGFYEKEIARRVEQFGQIAHVWSTYESRHDPDDAKPFMRGINSIQLFNDGKRWWILSIYWQQENAAHPIPKKYFLKQPTSNS